MISNSGFCVLVYESTAGFFFFSSFFSLSSLVWLCFMTLHAMAMDGKTKEGGRALVHGASIPT